MSLGYMRGPGKPVHSFIKYKKEMLMSGSIYGNSFVISTWGESHGEGIGVVVDGCPAVTVAPATPRETAAPAPAKTFAAVMARSAIATLPLYAAVKARSPALSKLMEN